MCWKKLLVLLNEWMDIVWLIWIECLFIENFCNICFDHFLFCFCLNSLHIRFIGIAFDFHIAMLNCSI